jgi:hypothetical protein
MGCPGCLLNEIEQQQSWDKALKDAKEYAIEKGVFMVVHKTETGEATFMEASIARELNIQGQFVSPVR